MNCQPTLSPYLNELHCARGAHSINGRRTLYSPLLLAVMRQKMWPHFPDITLGAIAEAALLIVPFIVDGTHPAGACSRCMWTLRPRLCVYCTKTPTSRLHFSHLWRCECGCHCSVSSAGYLLPRAKQTACFSAGLARSVLPGTLDLVSKLGYFCESLIYLWFVFVHRCRRSFIKNDSFVGQNSAAGACWVITWGNQSTAK